MDNYNCSGNVCWKVVNVSKFKDDGVTFPTNNVELDLYKHCLEIYVDEGQSLSISRALATALWTIVCATELDQKVVVGIVKDVMREYYERL